MNVARKDYYNFTVAMEKEDKEALEYLKASRRLTGKQVICQLLAEAEAVDRKKAAKHAAS